MSIPKNTLQREQLQALNAEIAVVDAQLHTLYERKHTLRAEADQIQSQLGYDVIHNHEGKPFWFNASTGEVISCNDPRFAPVPKMLDANGAIIMTPELKALIARVDSLADTEVTP